MEEPVQNVEPYIIVRLSAKDVVNDLTNIITALSAHIVDCDKHRSSHVTLAMEYTQRGYIRYVLTADMTILACKSPDET